MYTVLVIQERYKVSILVMTEVANDIQHDVPVKRPVGRPRKSNIPVPQTPPSTLEEYIAARNAYARDYYHAHKAATPRSQCKFINKAGRHCPHMTNRGYCYKHVSKAKQAE